jgi:hypothetical protein
MDCNAGPVASKFQRKVTMPSDNALLPPIIHLDYLTENDVIEQIQQARESIRFVGPGLQKAATTANNRQVTHCKAVRRETAWTQLHILVPRATLSSCISALNPNE